MARPKSNQVEESTSEQSAPKKGNKALLLIFLTVFIDLVGFGLIIPVLPTYTEHLANSAGIPSAGQDQGLIVGLLLASYSLMQFLFTPFWGRLSDKVGRRPILLISLAASSIGYLIWGFSNSLGLLFLSRIVAGFGNANIAVAQAYVSDVTTEENRAKGMGAVGAAFGLGFVLGPFIGGLCMYLNLGMQTIGFVAAAFSIIDLILTAIFLPEPNERSQAGEERFGFSPDFYFKTIADPKLTASLLIFFISTFAFANMEATLVLLTFKQFNFTPWQNSLMFLYIGCLIVVVQGGMIHRLSKKYGEKKLVLMGSLLVALGLLLTPFAPNYWVLGLPLALLAIGSGINTPSNQSMLSKLADREKVGMVMGVGQSLSTLGRILGPIVGGAAFQYLGLASPYVVGAVAMVVALVLALKLPDLKPAAS